MTNKVDIERLIERLAASTRSPWGEYTAAESRKILDRRIANRRRRSFLRVTASVAAVILLCVCSWSVYMYVTPAPIITVSTLAHTESVRLSDGTEVMLNRYTSLSYPKRFKQKNREVQLRGGAYFSVSKDPAHPFIVKAGDVNVEVLGTEFNVEAYPEDDLVKAILFKGLVAVSAQMIQQSLRLAPGEKATYDKHAKSITKEEASDIADALAWQKGTLIFNDLPLKEIARQLSNTFGAQLSIENEHLGQQRISARFIHGETLDDILLLLQEVGNFKVVRQNENIQLVSYTH